MVATFETDSFAYQTSERSICVSISDTSNVFLFNSSIVDLSCDVSV